MTWSEFKEVLDKQIPDHNEQIGSIDILHSGKAKSKSTLKAEVVDGMLCIWNTITENKS